MEGRTSRFSTRQVVFMVVAVCVTALALPVGVGAATGSLVNIADPFDGARKARVNGIGALWGAIVDPVTKSQARVVGGKVNVGDGFGPLTVDGSVDVGNTVRVTGAVGAVPRSPTQPLANVLGNGLTVPAGKRLVVETISVQATVTPATASLIANVRFTTGGAGSYLFVPLTNTGYVGGGYSYRQATQQVRFYADGGTQVFSDVSSHDGTTGGVVLTVTGYLV